MYMYPYTVVMPYPAAFDGFGNTDEQIIFYCLLYSMDNFEIADAFSLLSKLMDIHGENSFKVKSYANAAYTIEKLPAQLKDLPKEKIFSIKGIGDATGKKIVEMMETGKLSVLEDYITRTPPGVIEMLLNIKGLGAKKIAVIWKEMGVESIGELLYACNENRLSLFKGFGEKTQKNVKDSITFYQQSQGVFLYAQAEAAALSLQQHLENALPAYRFILTGAFRRQMETLQALEWVTTADTIALTTLLQAIGYGPSESTDTHTRFDKAGAVSLIFYHSTPESFGSVCFQTSCSGEFMSEWDRRFPSSQVRANEEDVFTSAGVHFIEPCRREFPGIIPLAQQQPLPPLIQTADIKGIIHSHSNWSDGGYTIEAMARAAIEQGYEYLVISDHSRSAFYANGLTQERLKEQHAYIDALNEQLKPFRVFKSIEADILNDGSLDYDDAILATFDLVIASVHSNLKMTEEKAMHRLLTAISNPYTTILGHMTGRLLLSRAGYPVDHEKMAEACVANQVVIELNAHPRRLDIDWRFIDAMLRRGGMISIDPDAHSLEGFGDIRYGVLAAQKAGVQPLQNLSSYSLQQFEQFLQQRKQLKGI